MTHPDDTPKQARLRLRVEAMMGEGKVRAEEADRVAEEVRQALLREPLSENAVLVLHDDGAVTWETP